MKTPLPGGDTRPWYRQFWPWFLIALPASVVFAGITTAVIAFRHADDLVADTYYKDGLAINRRMEKQQRAEQLGVSARLHFSGDTVLAAVSGPVDDAALRLTLSHPMEADRDFVVALARTDHGQFEANLDDAVAPRWHWALEQSDDAGWRLYGVVQAADIDHDGDD